MTTVDVYIMDEKLTGLIASFLVSNTNRYCAPYKAFQISSFTLEIKILLALPLLVLVNHTGGLESLR